MCGRMAGKSGCVRRATTVSGVGGGRADDAGGGGGGGLLQPADSAMNAALAANKKMGCFMWGCVKENHAG